MIETHQIVHTIISRLGFSVESASMVALENALEGYIHAVEHARHKFNLIGPNESVQAHIIDSIAPTDIFFKIFSGLHAKIIPVVADLGTGAGFPGLPLALLCSALQKKTSWLLVERSQKKCDFLSDTLTILRPFLNKVDVTVISANLKEWNPAVNIHVVTARAFSPISKVLHDLHRVAPRADFLFYKGKIQAIEEEFLASAPSNTARKTKPQARMKIETIHPLHHFPDKERHIVHAKIR